MTLVPAANPQSRVKAAQYVRMSTELQKYSTKNQIDAIATYAERRGFEIVETYEDYGKSGLTIRGRASLRRLIADVCTGAASFSVILVYDVSRWGRFQDVDESAHYEFVCRSAGIPIEYCAELFANDGSMSTTIIKNIKRMMAAEYSRDLSTKVFQGQCRLIRLGFRTGGNAGYGLRRVLLDENQKPKIVLRLGQRKSLTTDRVILRPGPRREVSVVRKIYRLFVVQDRSQTQIATELNSQGIPAERGGIWTLNKVRSVLSNEKYIGNNVFNRISYKLKTKPVANAAEKWVRHDAAFEPIVSKHIFESAQKKLLAGVLRHSNQSMLDDLRNLLKKNGRLSAKMIDKSETMACCDTYRKRFGTLVRAWKLIGYNRMRRSDYGFVEINKHLRAVRPGIISKVIAGIEAAGGTVTRTPKNDILTIDGGLRAYVSISRYLVREGLPLWYISKKLRPDRDVTILVRLDSDNVGILDYYLFPPHREKTNTRSDTELRDRNVASVDMWRCDDLSSFFDLTHYLPRAPFRNERMPTVAARR
jgi:DNA invertase Pin-like site-specific DNA recombinase